MKKILSRITSIIFLATSISTIDAKKIASVKPTTTTSTTTATPPIQGLVQANTQYKKAQTRQEKAEARKEVLKQAKLVMQFTTEERNIKGELIGYKNEEKEAAMAVLGELEAEKLVLEAIIKKYKDKRATLENKGFFWNSIKTGKTEQYNKLTKKINEFEPTLEELKTKIRNQSIIAGKQKFTKTRAFVAASVGTVLGLTGAYLWLGPTAATLEYNSFKNNPVQYMADRTSSLKSIVSGWMNSKATETVATEVDKTVADITKKQTEASLAARFGGAVSASVLEILAFAKDLAIQKTIDRSVSVAMKKLDELLESAETTPEQVQQQVNKIKTITKQQPQQKQTTAQTVKKQ